MDYRALGKQLGRAWRVNHMGENMGGVQGDAALQEVQARNIKSDDDMEFYGGWYAGIDEVDEENNQEFKA